MTDLTKYRTRYDADIAVGNVLAGDSDQAVADYYNAAAATPDAEIRASREQVMEAIDVSEFKALDAATRDAVGLVLEPESVLIRGSNARTIILDAFTAATGPNTRTNLGTLQAQLEAAAEQTRAQRGRLLLRSLSIIAADVAEMRKP